MSNIEDKKAKDQKLAKFRARIAIDNFECLEEYVPPTDPYQYNPSYDTDLDDPCLGKSNDQGIEILEPATPEEIEFHTQFREKLAKTMPLIHKLNKLKAAIKVRKENGIEIVPADLTRTSYLSESEIRHILDTYGDNFDPDQVSDAENTASQKTIS